MACLEVLMGAIFVAVFICVPLVTLVNLVQASKCPLCSCPYLEQPFGTPGPLQDKTGLAASLGGHGNRLLPPLSILGYLVLVCVCRRLMKLGRG